MYTARRHHHHRLPLQLIPHGPIDRGRDGTTRVGDDHVARQQRHARHGALGGKVGCEGEGPSLSEERHAEEDLGLPLALQLVDGQVEDVEAHVRVRLEGLRGAGEQRERDARVRRHQEGVDAERDGLLARRLGERGGRGRQVQGGDEEARDVVLRQRQVDVGEQRDGVFGPGLDDDGEHVLVLPCEFPRVEVGCQLEVEVLAVAGGICFFG